MPQLFFIQPELLQRILRLAVLVPRVAARKRNAAIDVKTVGPQMKQKSDCAGAHLDMYASILCSNSGEKS